jgi:aminoglycoside phosphotransferase (APT) family kinase protein
MITVSSGTAAPFDGSPLLQRDRTMRGVAPSPVEHVAATLGLRVLRPFEGGLFGAVLVEGRGDVPLVLKATDDVALLPTWEIGAAMAERLRSRSYPAPHYVEFAVVDECAYSLQEVLPGEVPLEFTASYADQLVELARAHDVDSGRRKQWDALARQAARGWVTDLAPLPQRFDEELAAQLDATADVSLLQTTVVHGDFHHRNFLAGNGRITGVFDWEIADAGDWRFDLVNLAFACQLYPRTCTPDAIETVKVAVRDHCDARTAAFFFACQTLRALSMVKVQRLEWVGDASRRMRSRLVEWWV